MKEASTPLQIKYLLTTLKHKTRDHYIIGIHKSHSLLIVSKRKLLPLHHTVSLTNLGKRLKQLITH